MRPDLLAACIAPGAGHWRAGRHAWALLFAAGALVGLVVAAKAMVPVVDYGIDLGAAVADHGWKAVPTGVAADALLGPLATLALVLGALVVWHGASIAHLMLVSDRARRDATSPSS